MTFDTAETKPMLGAVLLTNFEKMKNTFDRTVYSLCLEIDELKHKIGIEKAKLRQGDRKLDLEEDKLGLDKERLKQENKHKNADREVKRIAARRKPATKA